MRRALTCHGRQGAFPVERKSRLIEIKGNKGTSGIDTVANVKLR